MGCPHTAHGSSWASNQEDILRPSEKFQDIQRISVEGLVLPHYSPSPDAAKLISYAAMGSLGVIFEQASF